ncbi:hypothetical protein L210DRAFT_3477913 [Boletus edulis BED1]|uniref:DUF829-domain-containing protein n=1 Tax=Boletus edulis BED1 TaxID=1328754 RepID=A0AAD4GFP9_BOLED|nr:hypothetical protein L210DRAFT_3477913 [Boletus edulis BED1]
MPRPLAPAGFVTIGPGIYISLAHMSAAPLQLNDSAPNVILIFGWMGASTRHLQHYSRKYTELYPHATQIIVKCPPSFFWTSARGQQSRLLPVIEALEGLGCLPSTENPTHESTRVRPRVLIHSFSNGGGLQLTSLGHLLTSKYPFIPPSEHLVSALILDSSPAIGNFRSIGMAFSIAIRNPIIRHLALVFIYLMHAIRLSLQSAFGMDTMGTRYLKALFNPRLLPWMNSRTPRLYVFSKKDELVPWQGVHKHANDAITLGLNVRCEVYEESAHVTHMRLDPKRYWASVQELWEIAHSENQVQIQSA